MDNEKAFWYLQDLQEDMTQKILDEWASKRNNENPRQTWKVIPSKALIAEWNYNKDTSLTHESVIDGFQEVCVNNFLKLYINTVICGHTEISLNGFLEFYFPEDENWDEEKFEEYFEDYEWFIIDEFGQWRISDYAFKKLDDYIINLIAEEDYNKKLYWIDLILNVVHQRSDFARWFVEGGSSTLGALAN